MINQGGEKKSTVHGTRAGLCSQGKGNGEPDQFKSA